MIASIIKFSLYRRTLILWFALLLAAGSIWALYKTPLDALPDVSPAQVIIEVTWEGTAPKIIEEQATYPLVTTLLSLPHVQTVRAMSSYGSAMVYAIFKDGTNLYWARSRITETLTSMKSQLPKEALLRLGPDASGVGWVFEYALHSPTKNLHALRTLQEYHIKRALLSVDGVSDVATVGGFIPATQLVISQEAMMRYDLSITQIIQAIRNNHQSIGAGLITHSGFEWILQSEGYLQNANEIKNLVITHKNGSPVFLKDLGRVEIIPAPRRGAAELSGHGEVVGGIVMARYGANAYDVITRVKAKLNTLAYDDVVIMPVYDRSLLIDRSLATLFRTLIEEMIVVALVIALFLSHLRSTAVVVVVLPLTVGATFLCMKAFDIGSNIMSLGGMAIAIGTLIDASIIMIENVHKELALKPNHRLEAILHATQKVGPAIFFALLLVVVSFLPIFALQGQEGLLFSPLAFTKTFAMAVGALLSITLVPVLIFYWVKGEIKPESSHKLTTRFTRIYAWLLEKTLRYKKSFLSLMVLLLALSVLLFGMFKWEFLPRFDEQTVMYMPVTSYGLSIDAASKLLTQTNSIIKSFPEVATVFGKAGRADTPTDPAPLSMLETIITFKPKSQWREGMTPETLLKELDAALDIAGLSNAWTYPIKGRIDMLQTGVRTPLGIKLYGPDAKQLESTAQKMVQILQALPQTQAVFADQSHTGYFVDFRIKPEALARFNLTKSEIQTHVQTLIGGMTLAETFEGIYRFPVSIRLEENKRTSVARLKESMIKTPFGFVPLKMVCDITQERSSSVIKSENGLPVAYIYITPTPESDVVRYQALAQKSIEALRLPWQFRTEWTGASKQLQETKKTLIWMIPAVLLLILFCIYLALGDMRLAFMVFGTLPFALAGGIIYLWWLDFSMSIAVVVGFLALLGIAAETAIVMVIYIKNALHASVKEAHGIQAAIILGSVKRLRPKLMTVISIIAALLPVMIINDVGSEIMQKIAAPMLGGMITSTIATLFMIPILYEMFFETLHDPKPDMIQS